MIRRSVICAAALALAGGAAAQGSPPWTVYADCAAAYLANARLADPDRPASMTAQISDVSNDYATAALARYRRGARGPARAGAAVVRRRVQAQARRFAGQPRAAVERVIDACPQLET